MEFQILCELLEKDEAKSEYAENDPPLSAFCLEEERWFAERSARADAREKGGELAAELSEVPIAS